MKIINKLLVLLFVSIFMVGCAKDEVDMTGTIFGFVTNTTDGESVSNVNITLNPVGLKATTGSDGRYEFLDLEPGQYTVILQKEGYVLNSMKVNVVAGNQTIGDAQLTKVKVSTKINLSTNSLNFGNSASSLSFDINNIGNSGAINWTITGMPGWMTVTPSSGSVAMGKSNAVRVDLKRELITTAVTSTIMINAAGESLSITVFAEPVGGGDKPDGEVPGVVESCDDRVEIKLINIERLGTTVTLNFTLKNNAPEIDFLMEAYSSKTFAYDKVGNQYPNTDISLKLGSWENRETVRLTIPRNVLVNGYVKIKNVPETINEFSNITIGCYEYNYVVKGEKIVFKNIKIGS